MQRRFQQILLSWLLVLAIGGHWPLLQSVAWVKMIVSYSQAESLGSAFEKTFNGKNPCNLCLLVAQGKKAEQKESSHSPNVKIDFFLVENRPFEIDLPAFEATHFESVSFYSPLFSPPTPPPRFA